jgi:mRNA-degrading endonuclease RelE of RelBE toxin-antitoxin system
LQGKRSVRAGRDIRIVYAFDARARVIDVLDIAPRGRAYR